MRYPMRSQCRVLCAYLLALAAPAFADEKLDLHRQLLKMADRQQKERRALFAAVTSRAELEALQKSLREKFLRLLGGLPGGEGAPPAQILGTIVADDYIIQKLVFESASDYFVP